MDVRLALPSDADSQVRDEEARGDAERGYWAQVWPAAVALAEHVARSALIGPGVRVLEIGCGAGLVGIVAALRGADVVMTDYDLRAVALAARNAALNGVEARCEVFDWNDDPAALRADVLLGADVLYFEKSHEPIARLIARLGCVAILTDPNRAAADGVARVFRENGLACWATGVRGGRVLVVQRR